MTTFEQQRDLLYSHVVALYYQHTKESVGDKALVATWTQKFSDKNWREVWIDAFFHWADAALPGHEFRFFLHQRVRYYETAYDYTCLPEKPEKEDHEKAAKLGIGIDLHMSQKAAAKTAREQFSTSIGFATLDLAAHATQKCLELQLLPGFTAAER